MCNPISDKDKMNSEMTKTDNVKNDNDRSVSSGDGTQKNKAQEAGNVAQKKVRKKRSAAYYAGTFFLKVGITAAVIFLLLTFVVGIYINHSNSSYPMIKDGDLCMTYRLATLVDGDEIVYEHNGQIKFGRIVASSGDVIDINEEKITVNGYGVFEDAVYPTTAEGATITFPYTVPTDTVFVLNDYRDDPNDSRCYGAIPIKDTKGKIIMLLRRRGF